MKKSIKRTYTTTLIEAEQPIDLQIFCELVAQALLSDKNYISKGDLKNDGKKIF